MDTKVALTLGTILFLGFSLLMVGLLIGWILGVGWAAQRYEEANDEFLENRNRVFKMLDDTDRREQP